MNESTHITRRSFLAASAAGLTLAALGPAHAAGNPQMLNVEMSSWLRAQFHLKSWADLEQRLPTILDTLYPFTPLRVSAMGEYPNSFHLSVIGLNDNREIAELVLTSIDTRGPFGTVVYLHRRRSIEDASLHLYPQEKSQRMAHRLVSAARLALESGRAMPFPKDP